MLWGRRHNHATRFLNFFNIRLWVTVLQNKHVSWISDPLPQTVKTTLWCWEMCLWETTHQEKHVQWRLGTLNKQTDWINKLTFKDNTISYRFTLFICGGPRHLSSFKQCPGDLIFLWEQLVYSVMWQVSPHSYRGSEDVGHDTDCKAHWDSVIVVLGLYELKWFD